MARMLWVALLAAIVACAAAQTDFTGVIYAIEVGPDKRIFQINTTNPGVIREDTIQLVYDLTANRGTPEVDEDCFGLNFNTDPVTDNPSSPNALANDGVNRLYFTATDRPARTTPARLCFFSFTGTIGGKKIKFVEELQGYTVINGATFDQNGYNYCFVKDALEQQALSNFLNIVFASLSRITGAFRSVRIETSFRNTTAPGNPTADPFPLIYKGGDQAFNCERVFFASSIRVDGSDKYFFSVDFSPSSPPGGYWNYVLIANDNYLPDGSLAPLTDENPTGFATASQIAFDGEGDLVCQSSKDGIFSFVDLATGANNVLAPINTTNVQFLNPDGTLRRFADLASYLDCEVEQNCVDTFVTNPCAEGQQVLSPSPTAVGGLPCAPIEVNCTDPITCQPAGVCLAYQYI